MDKDWFLVNLKDAKSALDSLIADVESECSPEDVEAVAIALMPSVYTKINYAWNTRDSGNADLTRENEYSAAISFPKDIDV